ncbi:MAG: hypothetical protein NXI32_29005 [bacterium]|nr:hypothetical protein [bacterium]
MKMNPPIVLLILAAFISATLAEDIPQVRVARVPDQGLQPQIEVGTEGEIHLIYFRGAPEAGDLYYCRLTDAESLEWTQPIRVNSQIGSAVATGTIRGAQMALGKSDRVHVAWNGSGQAKPKGIAHPGLPTDSPYRFSAPMLYSRMNETGDAFEEQRNLMTHTYALDGGGSVAADPQGLVYVVWHANSIQQTGAEEADRAVWVAKSEDGGQTFSAETRANEDDTGACGCCGLHAFCSSDGRLWVMYRTATDKVHRDMHVLTEDPSQQKYESRLLGRWKAAICVMSTSDICSTPKEIFAAWENDECIQLLGLSESAPESKRGRPWTSLGGRSPHKHPRLAINNKGQMLLVWTEGTSWNNGGDIAWQLFDRTGSPIRRANGRAKGLETWSFAAAYANEDGSFTIVY